MIIKKININNCSEIRISKDIVNGRSLIQIRMWNKKNNGYLPTDRSIALSGKYLFELINGLEMTKYLESDIKGQS